MFCANCGSKMEENERFCAECGAQAEVDQTTAPKTPEPEQLIAPQQPIITEKASQPLENRAPAPAQVPVQAQVPAHVKKPFPIKAVLSVAVSVVLIAGIVGVIYGITRNSGRNAFYTALSRSVSAYNKEMKTFVDKNPVLKQLKTNFDSDYMMKLDLPDGIIVSFSDSKSQKIFELSVSGDSFPSRFRAYLSDTRLIAGMQGIAFYEVNPKAMGSDIMAFADSLDALLDSDLRTVADELDKLDLSYTGLTKSGLAGVSPDSKEYQKTYTNLMKSLFEMADFNKTDSTFNTGDKTVDTTLLTFSANYRIVGDWMKKELLPTIRNDKSIRDMLNSMADMPRMGLDVSDFDEFIYDLEDAMDDIIFELEKNDYVLFLRTHIHKGVIISLEIGAAKYGDFDYATSVVVSAAGEDYRLNKVVMEFNENGYTEFSITLEGDIIGADVIDANLTFKERNRSNERYRLRWDTTASRNNFRFSGDGVDERMSFYADGKNVRFIYEYESWYDSYEINARIAPLEGKIELPEKTTRLRDANVSDFMDSFSELFGGYGNNFYRYDPYSYLY